MLAFLGRGPLIHQIPADGFQPQRQGRRPVHDNVNPQQLQRGKRRGKPGQNGGQHHDHRGQVHRELELDKALEILVYSPPHWMAFTMVEKRRPAAQYRWPPWSTSVPGDAHGDAHIRVFERWGVVDSVPGDRHHISQRF